MDVARMRFSNRVWSGPGSIGKLEEESKAFGAKRALIISDEGIKLRDELVVENFFSRRIPFCGVLGGGYNKDFNKLVELHSMLHQSCAKYIGS